MHADSHYVIGHDHTVCQDYATHWRRKDGSIVAAMADGCSTAPDTDVGARLLVLAAKTNLFVGLQNLEGPLIQEIPAPPGDRGLDYRAFRATLGVVVANADGAQVRLWGDGVVLALRHSGEVDAVVVNYDEGAPPYLSYKKYPEEVEAYRELSKNGAHTMTFIERGQVAGVRKGTNPNLESLDLSYPASIYKMVAVCSDGLLSVYGPSGAVPYLDVVLQVGAILNTSGEFVVRKLRNGLPKFLKKLGAVHADDVSMAAVVLDGGAA